MRDPEEDRRRHAELKRAHGEAFARLNDILFAEDPAGVNCDDNPDEYEPEVGTILPRLASARSVDDVRRIVHEELVHWFDLIHIGPEEKHQVLAERVWKEVVPLLPRA
jgi:hypothetical protein